MSAMDCGPVQKSGKVKEDKLFERHYCSNCGGSGKVWVKSHGAFGENDSYWGSCHCDGGYIYKEVKGK